jgi:hypothetical protein
MLATEAKKLLAADEHYQKAKGELQAAKADLDKARATCRPLLAIDKTTTIGDIAITVTACVSAATFRLADFKRRYKVTKQMEPFIGERTPYEKWTVRRVGP